MTGELSELYAWSPQNSGERELSTLGDQAWFLIGSMHRDTVVRVSSGGDHRHFVPSEVRCEGQWILACGTQVVFDGIQAPPNQATNQLLSPVAAPKIYCRAESLKSPVVGPI